MTKKIYLVMNTPMPVGHAVAIAESGMELGAAICAAEDLLTAMNTTAARSLYDMYYPDGYELEVVAFKDAFSHEGLQAAIADENAPTEEELKEFSEKTFALFAETLGMTVEELMKNSDIEIGNMLHDHYAALESKESDAAA